MQQPARLIPGLRRRARRFAAVALLLYVAPLALPCAMLMADAAAQPACHAQLPASDTADHCLGQLLAGCDDGALAQDARDFSVAKFTPAVVTTSLISVAPIPARPLTNAQVAGRAPPDSTSLILSNCVFLL